MDFFDYKNSKLHCEDASLEQLAKQYGTPLFVYSRATLERHWKAFDDALSGRPHLVCYAVKANSNLAVLNVLARLGSGFDIVSAGELQRVIKAGGEPSKIVFSGVGKQPEEIKLALKHGIRCFNIESEPELDSLNQIAASMDKVAPISFRVNPDVDAKTHPYISTGLKENKFGIHVDDAERVYLKAKQMKNVKIQGIDCHIGSQLTDVTPFTDALDRLLFLINKLAAQDIVIHHIDFGGGLGVRYKNETPPLPHEWASAINNRLGDFKGEVLVEPGRAIAANAGVLLTEVNFLKKTSHKNFAIVDAAMNDMIRPSLYQAWQNIITVSEDSDTESDVYDVVGPVCETTDFLGKDRNLSINSGDLLAMLSAGAYGFTMSSNYNTRVRAAEVMVDGNNHFLVRARETFDDLIKGESILP